MKLLKSVLMGCAAICLFDSCKKDTINSDEPSTDLKEEITMSSRGYLVFPNVESVVSYGQLLASNPNNEVALNIRKLGFKNFGQNISNTQGASNNPYSDFFDENGFLQVSNVVLKLSSDEQFVYTLNAAMADSVNYNLMLNEVYNAIIMNKINVDRDFSLPFEFFAFMAANPNGENESLNTSAAKRKMFGSTTTHPVAVDPPMYNGYGNCQVCTHTYSQTTTYFFWIANVHQPVYQSTSCVASVGCN
jgi:hypothetical protein